MDASLTSGWWNAPVELPIYGYSDASVFETWSADMLGGIFEIYSIGDDCVPVEMAASEYAGTELKHFSEYDITECYLLDIFRDFFDENILRDDPVPREMAAREHDGTEHSSPFFYRKCAMYAAHDFDCLPPIDSFPRNIYDEAIDPVGGNYGCYASDNGNYATLVLRRIREFRTAVHNLILEPGSKSLLVAMEEARTAVRWAYYLCSPLVKELFNMSFTSRWFSWLPSRRMKFSVMKESVGDIMKHYSAPDQAAGNGAAIKDENYRKAGTWLVATAAPHHATGNRELLTGFMPDEDIFLQAGDGTPMEVRGRGAVVTDAVVLPDVCFVPGLAANLVSAGKLAELGYTIRFARGACRVIDGGGSLAGEARLGEDGMFELQFLKLPLAV